jgi:hypothetical protein
MVGMESRYVKINLARSSTLKRDILKSFGRRSSSVCRRVLHHLRTCANSSTGGILFTTIFLLIPETSLAIKARQAASLNPPIPLPSMSPSRTPSVTSHQSVAVTLLSRIISMAWTYLVLPFGSLLYLLFPPIGLTAVYSSICFGALYGLSTTTPFTFSEPPYNLETVDISFTYLPTCFGYIIGSVGGGYLSDWELRRAKAKYGDNYPPECRMRSARWGVPLIPAGLIIFGWGTHRFMHIAIPCVGGFVFGVGLMLTNGTVHLFLCQLYGTFWG